MKNLLIALALFVSPLAHADSRNDIAAKRLDLALSLINALADNLVCEVDAYPASINQEVSAAWYLASDAQKADFLAAVPANSEMRNDLAFRVATESVKLGTYDQTLEQFSTSLLGTVHHSLGQGAYGSGINITLLPNGDAKVMTLELLENEPYYRWVESRTTWSVAMSGENAYTLKIGEEVYNFNTDYTHDGEVYLVPVGVNEGEEGYYNRVRTSAPSYCEA